MKKIRSNLSFKFELIATSVIFILLFILTVSITNFYNFKKHATTAIKVQTEEINRQITYNYENSINQIINVNNLIQTELEQTNIKNNKEDVLSFLKSLIKTNNNILEIGLYDLDKELLVKTSDLNSEDNQWFEAAKNDSTIHYFSSPQTDGEKTFLSVSRRVSNDYITSYIIKIDYNFDNFIELANKTSLGDMGHITIFDYDYNLVYSSGSNNFKDEKELFKDLIIGSKEITYYNEPMILNIDTLLHTKWRIAVFSNINEINNLKDSFYNNMIIISTLFIIIGISFFYLISNLIINPLRILEKNMKLMVKDNYLNPKELTLNTNLEITSLTNSYNKMVNDIVDLMEEIEEKHNMQIKSELKALQNQINPHFLYNTLESIIWLVSNNKNEEATKMILSLSKLFRISISQGDNIIYVKDEMEHALSYLEIQSIRYPDSFEYEFNISDDVLKLKTMKLILQPFIENSIYHGLKHNIDLGHIYISAKVLNNNLVYEIKDNGYGMKEELVLELNNSLEDKEVSFGIGIKNVYERLKVYYGSKANVVIDSELDYGTTITIVMPIGEDELL